MDYKPCGFRSYFILLTMALFDSSQALFFTVLTQSRMCVIADRCYKPFRKSPWDPCLICDPDVSRVSWSRSADPGCLDESDDIIPIGSIIVGVVCGCLFLSIIVAVVVACRWGIATKLCRKRDIVNPNQGNLDFHHKDRPRLAFTNETYVPRDQRPASPQRF